MGIGYDLNQWFVSWKGSAYLKLLFFILYIVFFFLSTNAYIALIVLNIKTKHDVYSLFMYQTCFYSSWKKSIPMHKLNCDFLKVAESKCTNTTTSKWNTEGKNQESENNHNKYKGSLLDPNRINQGITQLNVIWKEWIEADDKWQMYSMQKITLKCFPHSQINCFTGWPLMTPAVFMLEIFAYSIRSLHLPEIQFRFWITKVLTGDTYRTGSLLYRVFF